MQAGTLRFAAKFPNQVSASPNHSDGIVVVDRWGNVAAVTHSINTTLWGDTGIFVGGVSIPDSAAIQQRAVKLAGPGKRLPDPMCPLIVLKDGKPSLGSSAIGGGLHQKTLQVLANVLDFGNDPQAAVEQPAFLMPDFAGAGPPVARVEKRAFDDKLLEATRALGQQIREASAAEAAAFRGYWVGAQIAPDGKLRRAFGTRKAPVAAVAEGY